MLDMDQCCLRWNNKDHSKKEYKYFKYTINFSDLVYGLDSSYFEPSFFSLKNVSKYRRYKYIRIRKEYSNRVLFKIAAEENLKNPYKKPFSRSKLKRYINCIEITKREYIKNK